MSTIDATCNAPAMQAMTAKADPGAHHRRTYGPLAIARRHPALFRALARTYRPIAARQV